MHAEMLFWAIWWLPALSVPKEKKESYRRPRLWFRPRNICGEEGCHMEFRTNPKGSVSLPIPKSVEMSTVMMHPLKPKSRHSLGTWFWLPGMCCQVAIHPEVNCMNWILSGPPIRNSEVFINNPLYKGSKAERSNRHGTKNSVFKLQLKDPSSVPKWPVWLPLSLAGAKSIFHVFALPVWLPKPSGSCFSML